MITQPLWMPPVRHRTSPSLVELRQRPARIPHGCRTRLDDGTRCRHPERAHKQPGFEGWRHQCTGCGCRAYRQPWSTLTQQAACITVIVLLLLFIAVAVVGQGAW